MSFALRFLRMIFSGYGIEMHCFRHIFAEKLLTKLFI